MDVSVVLVWFRLAKSGGSRFQSVGFCCVTRVKANHCFNDEVISQLLFLRVAVAVPMVDCFDAAFAVNQPCMR